MKTINGLKYSQEKFEDYKLRVMFRAEVEGQDYHPTITIYTTDTDRENVWEVVNSAKKDKAKSLKLEHWATKEQDDRDTEFLDEILKDI